MLVLFLNYFQQQIGKKKKKGPDVIEQQQQVQQPSALPKSPVKPVGGSLDKIHAALSRQFPGVTK